MAFAGTSGLKTQTGTDNSLAGLNGLNRVTRTGTSEYYMYDLDNAWIRINGTLTINPENEVLYIRANGGARPINVNSGTLNIGNEANQTTSIGTAVVFEYAGQGTGSPGFIVGGSGTFNMYGSNIITRGMVVFSSGSTIKFRNATIKMKHPTKSRRDLRFETDNLDISGLTLKGFNFIIYTKTNATIKGITTVNIAGGAISGSGVTPDGNTDIMTFEDYEGINNTVDANLYSGIKYRLVDTATGTNVKIKGEGTSDNSGVIEHLKNIKFKFTDDDGDASDVKIYIKDTDNGNRVQFNATWDWRQDKIYQYTANATGDIATFRVLLGVNSRGGSTGRSNTANDGVNAGTNICDLRCKTNTLGEDDFDIKIFSYLHNYKLITKKLQGKGTLELKENMVLDLFITEKTYATVRAYTKINTAQRLYDRAKADLYNAYAGETDVLLTRADNTIDAKALNITINGTIGTSAQAFAISNNNADITYRTDKIECDITTTGTITLTNNPEVLGFLRSSNYETVRFDNIPTGDIYLWIKQTIGGVETQLKLLDGTNSDTTLYMPISKGASIKYKVESPRSAFPQEKTFSNSDLSTANFIVNTALYYTTITGSTLRTADFTFTYSANKIKIVKKAGGTHTKLSPVEFQLLLNKLVTDDPNLVGTEAIYTVVGDTFTLKKSLDTASEFSADIGLTLIASDVLSNYATKVDVLRLKAGTKVLVSVTVPSTAWATILKKADKSELVAPTDSNIAIGLAESTDIIIAVKQEHRPVFITETNTGNGISVNPTFVVYPNYDAGRDFSKMTTNTVWSSAITGGKFTITINNTTQPTNILDLQNYFDYQFTSNVGVKFLAQNGVAVYSMISGGIIIDEAKIEFKASAAITKTAIISLYFEQKSDGNKLSYTGGDIFVQDKSTIVTVPTNTAIEAFIKSGVAHDIADNYSGIQDIEETIKVLDSNHRTIQTDNTYRYPNMSKTNKYSFTVESGREGAGTQPSAWWIHSINGEGKVKRTYTSGTDLIPNKVEITVSNQYQDSSLSNSRRYVEVYLKIGYKLNDGTNATSENMKRVSGFINGVVNTDDLGATYIAKYENISLVGTLSYIEVGVLIRESKQGEPACDVGIINIQGYTSTDIINHLGQIGDLHNARIPAVFTGVSFARNIYTVGTRTDFPTGYFNNHDVTVIDIDSSIRSIRKITSYRRVSGTQAQLTLNAPVSVPTGYTSWSNLIFTVVYDKTIESKEFEEATSKEVQTVSNQVSANKNILTKLEDDFLNENTIILSSQEFSYNASKTPPVSVLGGYTIDNRDDGTPFLLDDPSDDKGLWFVYYTQKGSITKDFSGDNIKMPNSIKVRVANFDNRRTRPVYCDITITSANNIIKTYKNVSTPLDKAIQDASGRKAGGQETLTFHITEKDFHESDTIKTLQVFIYDVSAQYTAETGNVGIMSVALEDNKNTLIEGIETILNDVYIPEGGTIGEVVNILSHSQKRQKVPNARWDLTNANQQGFALDGTNKDDFDSGEDRGYKRYYPKISKDTYIKLDLSKTITVNDNKTVGKTITLGVMGANSYHNIYIRLYKEGDHATNSGNDIKLLNKKLPNGKITSLLFDVPTAWQTETVDKLTITFEKTHNYTYTSIILARVIFDGYHTDLEMFTTNTEEIKGQAFTDFNDFLDKTNLDDIPGAITKIDANKTVLDNVKTEADKIPTAITKIDANKTVLDNIKTNSDKITAIDDNIDNIASGVFNRDKLPTWYITQANEQGFSSSTAGFTKVAKTPVRNIYYYSEDTSTSKELVYDKDLTSNDFIGETLIIKYTNFKGANYSYNISIVLTKLDNTTITKTLNNIGNIVDKEAEVIFSGIDTKIKYKKLSIKFKPAGTNLKTYIGLLDVSFINYGVETIKDVRRETDLLENIGSGVFNRYLMPLWFLTVENDQGFTGSADGFTKIKKSPVREIYYYRDKTSNSTQLVYTKNLLNNKFFGDTLIIKFTNYRNVNSEHNISVVLTKLDGTTTTKNYNNYPNGVDIEETLTVTDLDNLDKYSKLEIKFTPATAGKETYIGLLDVSFINYNIDTLRSIEREILYTNKQILPKIARGEFTKPIIPSWYFTDTEDNGFKQKTANFTSKDESNGGLRRLEYYEETTAGGGFSNTSREAVFDKIITPADNLIGGVLVVKFTNYHLVNDKHNVVLVLTKRSDNTTVTYTNNNVDTPDDKETTTEFTITDPTLDYIKLTIKIKPSGANKQTYIALMEVNSTISKYTIKTLDDEVNNIKTVNLSGVEAKIDTNKNLLDGIKTKTDDTNTKVTATQTKQGTIDSKIDDIKNKTDDTNTKTTAIQTDTGTIKTDVGTVKTDVSTIKTDTGTIKTDVGTVKTDVGTVKTDTGTIKTDVGTVKTTTTDTNTKVGAIQTAQGTIGTKIDDIKNKTDNISNLATTNQLENTKLLLNNQTNKLKENLLKPDTLLKTYDFTGSKDNSFVVNGLGVVKTKTNVGYELTSASKRKLRITSPRLAISSKVGVVQIMYKILKTATESYVVSQVEARLHTTKPANSTDEVSVINTTLTSINDELITLNLDVSVLGENATILELLFENKEYDIKLDNDNENTITSLDKTKILLKEIKLYDKLKSEVSTTGGGGGGGAGITVANILDGVIGKNKLTSDDVKLKDSLITIYNNQPDMLQNQVRLLDTTRSRNGVDISKQLYDIQMGRWIYNLTQYRWDLSNAQMEGWAQVGTDFDETEYTGWFDRSIKLFKPKTAKASNTTLTLTNDLSGEGQDKPGSSITVNYISDSKFNRINSITIKLYDDGGAIKVTQTKSVMYVDDKVPVGSTFDLHSDDYHTSYAKIEILFNSPTGAETNIGLVSVLFNYKINSTSLYKPVQSNLVQIDGNVDVGEQIGVSVSKYPDRNKLSLGSHILLNNHDYTTDNDTTSTRSGKIADIPLIFVLKKELIDVANGKGNWKPEGKETGDPVNFDWKQSTVDNTLITFQQKTTTSDDFFIARSNSGLLGNFIFIECALIKPVDPADDKEVWFMFEFTKVGSSSAIKKGKKFTLKQRKTNADPIIWQYIILELPEALFNYNFEKIRIGVTDELAPDKNNTLDGLAITRIEQRNFMPNPVKKTSGGGTDITTAVFSNGLTIVDMYNNTNNNIIIF